MRHGLHGNNMALLAITLSVGIVIDDAIVVSNIFRYIEEERSPVEAAIEGTREVALAVGDDAVARRDLLPIAFAN